MPEDKQNKPTLTQRLTRTLGLAALARTLNFSGNGVCPQCRLVQTIGDGCQSGCDAQPRRIAGGDTEFFEPLRRKIKVVGEDPKQLRNVRVGFGLLGYLGALIGSTILLTPYPDLIALGILGSAAVPLGVAMAPRLKRNPPTVSSVLAAAPARRALPPSTDDAVIGVAYPVADSVHIHIGQGKALAAGLTGHNKAGAVVIRSVRSKPFRIAKGDREVIIRGPMEFIGKATVTNETVDGKLVKQLGLRAVDTRSITWREYVVSEGDRVRVYGTVERKHVPERAGYRDHIADVIESPTGTIIELLGLARG